MSALEGALRGTSGADAWCRRAAARIGVGRIQEREAETNRNRTEGFGLQATGDRRGAAELQLPRVVLISSWRPKPMVPDPAGNPMIFTGRSHPTAVHGPACSLQIQH